MNSSAGVTVSSQKMQTFKIQTLDWSTLLAALTPREKQANKGDFGHVLVVGGDYGYAGAVCMAGCAALRVGAGLVSIATRVEHAWNLFTYQPELMAHGISEGDVASSPLPALLDRADVIVIGPGLGQSEWAQRLASACFASSKPCVIDADALPLFAQSLPFTQPAVITPHPGEAARLLRCSVSEIQSDRVSAIQKLVDQFKVTAVLKGAGTLILDGSSHVEMCTAGNPGMATAGMGDILSGMIAGLIAQRLPVSQAAKIAVMCHALAGDRVAAQSGQRGMVATDLLPIIHQLINGK